MSLRSRAASKGNHNDSNKLLHFRIGNSQEHAQSVLTSLRYCYRMCVLSVVADLIVVMIDDEIFSKIFGANKLVWTDIIDIIDTMIVMIFGRGLRMSSRLYQKMMDKPHEHMSDGDAMKVFHTMGIVWTCCTFCLGAVAAGNAAMLPIHATGGPFSHFFQKITPSKCILCTFGFMATANFVIRMYCRLAIAKGSKGGISMIDIRKVLTAKPVYSSYEHAIGHRAYLSQAFCMGSIAAIAILDLLKWVVSDSSIIGKIFDVSDVITPFALTALLFSLNNSCLRAGLFGKLKDDKDNEEQVRHSLFVAQKGFYDKVAEIIKGVTIVRLLPYVVSPIKPYATTVINQYAPELAEKINVYLKL